MTSSVEAEPRTVVPLILKTPESEARERLFAKRFVVEAALRRTVPKVEDAELKFWMVDDAVEMKPPVVNLWSPVHVGAMV